LIFHEVDYTPEASWKSTGNFTPLPTIQYYDLKCRKE
jgi:hypothetical protein